MPLHTVCALSEIPADTIKQAALKDGAKIALYNVDGKVYATADACTHGAASLSEDGILDGQIVECSWHFGRFDVTTGEPCASPCTIPLKTYRVEIVDGIVSVEV